MSEHRLHEIVIERPRHGGGFKSPKGSKKLLQKNGLDWIQRESMKKPWQRANDAKSLSDHLAPLKRLLWSKVGQNWDDIYSELCQRLDKNSVIGLHVFNHIWDFVEKDVIIIDDIPYDKVSHRRICYWRDQLYIHPETGILSVAKKQYQKSKNESETTVININQNHEFRKIKDVWFLIKFQEILPEDLVKDVIIEDVINYDNACRRYGKPIYPAIKQQCNKKHLKLIRKMLTIDNE